MKHLKPIRKRKNDPTDGFEPMGKKDCEMKCDREVRMTKEGPVVVCHGCKRVVMDNRDKLK
jgi:hypothetical protein